MTKMVVKNKEKIQTELGEVQELTLVGDGYLLISGKNSRLEIGFYHVEFRSIKFTIEDPRLSEMTVSSIVEGVTDDKILIKIQNSSNDGSERPTKHAIPDEKGIMTSPRHRLSIGLNKVKELDFKNSGTVLIPGDNSLLSLGFHEDDFTFIKFTIEDTNLNRMRVTPPIDGKIYIKVLEPDDW